MTTRCGLMATLLMSAALLSGPSVVQAGTLNPSDYLAGKRQITATYKADKLACGMLIAHAKDVCVEEARAKEGLARAELAFRQSGKPADATRIGVARAEGAYAVAKERCGDQRGKVREACVARAQSTRLRAVGEPSLVKDLASAEAIAASAARDASYKVDADKCEALGAEARAACISTAKGRFSKT